jgi:phosphoribosylformimino-5-aminoimidazole carboxamide ribotide isomerase
LVDLGFARLQISDRDSELRGWTDVDLVEEILRDTNAQIQIDGVSATSDIELLVRLGVEHVVVGSRGIDEPEWLADVSELYPDAISVATDVRDRRVARRGWVRTLPVDVLDLVDELNALQLRELVMNVRSFDAPDQQRELALLEDVAERARFPVIVAASLAGIEDCRALEHRGIAGALIEASRLVNGELDGRAIAREFGV